MGEEKYSVDFQRQKLIAYPLELAKQLGVNEVIVVGNDSQFLSGDFTFVQDEHDATGPLGGIYTGLKKSNNELNVVLPCDTPFINKTLINVLLENSQEADITIPSFKDQLHPTIGVYKKNLLPGLKSFIDSGKRKMMDFVLQNKMKILTEEYFGDHADSKTFANLNTKSDIQRYEG